MADTSTLYYIRALTQSEVALDEDDQQELDELIEAGDSNAIAALFDDFDGALSVNLTDEQVAGYEIVDADGKVILKEGQEVPGIVRV
jgi:hypothetical protein